MGVEVGTSSSLRVTLRFYRVRDWEVILDRDLAAIYGIPTKVLNKYVERHAERFPDDFAFKLTREENDALGLAPSGGRGKHTKYCPRAFTEAGVMMVASIMRSRRAAAISIELLRPLKRSRVESDMDVFEITRGILGNVERIDLLERELLRDDPPRVTYFVQAGTSGPIKIGVTTNFDSRFSALQMSSPQPLRVLGVVKTDIENECHVMLAKWRLHGEWFEPTDEVLDFIRKRVAEASSVN